MTEAMGNGTAARRRGRPKKDWSLTSVGSLPLAAAFDASLEALGWRDADVVAARLGWGVPRQTLEEASSRHGITKEAARQSVLRFARLLFDGDLHVARVASAFRAAVSASGGAAPVPSLEGTDPLFDGLEGRSDLVSSVLDLVALTRGGRGEALPAFVGAREGGHLVDHPIAAWNSLVEDLATAVRLAPSFGVLDRADRLTQGLAPAVSDLALSLAMDEGSFEPRFGDVATCVRMLVEDSPEPVTAAEIAAHVSDRTGRPMTVQNAVGVANRVAVRISRGRYSTSERVGLTAEQTDAVRAGAVSAITTSEAREWHANEILSAIASRPGVPQGLTLGQIEIALDGECALRALGRMVYASAGTEGPRTQVRTLVIAAIREAGRPLSTAEIREAVSRVRGLGPSFQVFEGNGVVRMGRGLFGTEDMAVASSVNEARAALAAMAAEDHRGGETLAAAA